MSIKDFKSFVGDQKATGRGTFGVNVPIVGQTPPPIVLDALNRQLQVGDFVILQTVHEQPFRVQSIQPVEQPGQPPLMHIILSSTVAFLSQRNLPNQEFLRCMTADEIAERQQKGEASTGVDKSTVEATDKLPETEVPPQTLGDA